MKFKIGDRIELERRTLTFKGQVIETGDVSSNRYKIRKNNAYNVSGDQVETWVSGSELELDKEYYAMIRDQKINKILK